MNLKYLKLYEAFNSSKLSKTLAYLKSESKGNFLDLIKDIGKLYNIPISEISDSDFEYLSYKKAFNLFKDSENIPNLIKFWFSSDGKFIKSSYCDAVSSVSFSRKLSDYDIVMDLDLNDLAKLEEGAKILLTCSKGTAVSYLFKPKGDRYKYYLLQDELDGSCPNNNFYLSIAKKSWCIDNRGDYRSMKLLEPKFVEKSDNFLNYDFVIKRYAKDRYGRIVEVQPSNPDWKTGEPKVTLTKIISSDESLKDANFALVLDLDSFRSKSHTNLTELTSKREEQKKGAFVTPDKIKSENIDRYITKIMGSTVTSEITPIYIKRLVGYDKILFIKDYVKLEKKIDKAITKYTKLLETGTKRNATDVIKYLKKHCIESLNANKNYVSNMSDIRTKLKQDGNTKSLEILDTLEELSGLIYKKLNIDKIENVYDLEVLLGRISTINSLFTSKRNGIDIIARYFLKNCMNSSSSLVTSYSYRTIAEERFLPDINVFRAGVARIKEIVSRWS
jgi:hypothetical protein